MNQLVELLMQKTGLSQEKAQQVVETVVGHFKENLPSPIASHLESFLGGSGSAGEGGIADKAKSMMAGLSGILGKQDE